MTRLINPQKVNKHTINKIRALPDYEQINARINTLVAAERERLLAEVYNKRVLRKGAKNESTKEKKVRETEVLSLAKSLHGTTEEEEVAEPAKKGRKIKVTAEEIRRKEEEKRGAIRTAHSANQTAQQIVRPKTYVCDSSDSSNNLQSECI